MRVLRVLYPFAFCQLYLVTLAAATPAQPISFLINNATTNVNQAYNTTSTGPSNFLPPEPYYQVVGTWLSIKLYGFFLRIPQSSMDVIYAEAEADASIHQHSMAPMGPHRTYTWNLTAGGGELALCFIPGAQMTWAKWWLVLCGIKQFMMAFEYVELDFDVLLAPVGPIAHGTIHLTIDPGR